MQTRADLYELLDYEGYSAFDAGIFTFDLEQQPERRMSDRPDRHQEGTGRASSSTPPRSRRSTPRPTRCSTAATRCRSSPTNCSFEEVAYLLWHGELPTPAQLAEFEQLERAQRALDADVKRVIDELPLTAHPMDVVRTAVSVLGASDPEAAGHAPRRRTSTRPMRLFAQLPAIVAYDQRRRRGAGPRASRATTSATAPTSCT